MLLKYKGQSKADFKRILTAKRMIVTLRVTMIVTLRVTMIVTLRVTMIVTDAPANIAFLQSDITF